MRSLDDKVLLFGHAYEQLVAQILYRLRLGTERSHYEDAHVVEPAILKYGPRQGGPCAYVKVVVVARLAKHVQRPGRTHVL